MEFPKMVYKTRQDYKIVKNEVELKDAFTQGFKTHSDLIAVGRIDSERVKQIDSKIERVSKEIKILEKKKRK